MISNLIIKSSYSTLPTGEIKSNFGDLVRSTILLNCINEDYLWLTNEKSISLLKFFVDPKKIITFKEGIDTQNILSELVVYNIDNYITDRKLFSKIKGKWKGYIFNGNGLETQNKFIINIEPYTPSMIKSSWQESLIRGMGFKWKKQDYAFPTIRKNETVDVGLNWHVHPKWKTKQWPKEYWKQLAGILKEKYSVSWQQGLKRFDKYIDWISSCRLIVTCDTLGLHLASALRKKVIAIVGSTENREFSYKRIFFIRPKTRGCMPCNSPDCYLEKNCLSEIAPEKVAKFVSNVL